MVSYINPFRHNPKDDAERSERAKRNPPPPDDRFRKSMDDKRPIKDEEEHATALEERDELPSPFELSKSNKPKSKSSFQSTLKDSSSSDNVVNRPISEREEQGSSQDQNQNTEANIETPPEEVPETPEPTQKRELTPQQQMDGLKQQEAASTLRAQKVKGEEGTFETNKLSQTSKKDKTSKKEEASSGKTSEAKAEGMGLINAAIESASFQTEKAEEVKETISSKTIQELATEIIDRIQIMRKGDETQTMITLRHPPILDGATITLTTSDQAKREFSISFANLSPEAKLLLDRKLKEDPLTETLERKGIIVNALTTSTQPENLMTAESNQASRDQQEQRQGQQEQQQRERNFQEEEEEGVT